MKQSEAGKGDRNRSMSKAYQKGYERINWKQKDKRPYVLRVNGKRQTHGAI